VLGEVAAEGLAHATEARIGVTVDGPWRRDHDGMSIEMTLGCTGRVDIRSGSSLIEPTVGDLPMHARTFVPHLLLLSFVAFAACSDDSAPATRASIGAGESAPSMRLGDDEAGRIVRRSIDAAGGWATWKRLQDVEFVATLTIFARSGEVASETIFLHKVLLHRPGVRVDSIGLIEPVIFGYDGERDWMLRGGRAVTSLTGTAFTRFHAMGDAFWFGLPFVLAERPGDLSYLGAEEEEGRRWERVRVAYQDPTLPADWMVLYFDADSGLIGKVHARITAEFLTHPLWMARLREYQEVGGLVRERRRLIYPADIEGKAIGPLAAEELVEHIRFDSGWTEELFIAPLAAGGGNPAG
jgi:hypothetical protein